MLKSVSASEPKHRWRSAVLTMIRAVVNGCFFFRLDCLGTGISAYFKANAGCQFYSSFKNSAWEMKAIVRMDEQTFISQPFLLLPHTNEAFRLETITYYPS